LLSGVASSGPPGSAAVLLAAGLSRRMGARNKLLIEIHGEPMVRRVARLYLAACAHVYAIVGYEAERVRDALKDLPVTVVENTRFAEGQAASVRVGLENLTGRYNAVVMALADQAALTADDIVMAHAAIRWCSRRILFRKFSPPAEIAEVSSTLTPSARSDMRPRIAVS
jgi:CTP:molybdopterin cytidylyltransferase MocA